METISISKFKATCLALLERVRKTGQPILVTKRGVPVARVLPPPRPEPSEVGAYGCMAGSAEQVGDIVEPLPVDDWEALR